MKVAIVTGGGRGIGAAFSRRMMKLGYNVVINGTYDSNHLNKLVDELNAEHKDLKAVKAIGSVDKYEDCEKIVKTAIDEFGRLDCLVNNAGIVNTGLFADIPVDKYEKCIAVDLIGTMNMAHVAIPHLIKQERSDIINISSIMGITAAPTNTDYCAAKHGVIGFTRGLAHDYANRNLRVNAICPGVMETDILKDADPAVLEGVVKTIPMGRIGNVEDCADALEYLLKSNYTTGQYVSPNGGAVMV